MPWSEPTVVDLRYELIMKHLREGLPVSELASRYGVSRKTAYKWIKRFQEQGKAGLTDQSRAPRSCPHRIEEEVTELLLGARKKHPTWGPRKIIPWLQKRDPGREFPAPSTVGDLYRRHDLVRRRRRRGSQAGSKIKAQTEPKQPNLVWTIDYKGEFRTKNALYCYPLTIVDGYSRYILDVRALRSTCYRDARQAMKRCFRQYGLPEVIRSDNGVPFAVPNSSGALSRLSAWWTQLGIRHERIDPGRPDQNGSHERMHKTLKGETVRPPARDLRAQQRRFETFRNEYNYERPHEAHGQRTPSEFWTPSARKYPERLPSPQYPGHFEVRRITKSGTFRFGANRFFVGRALSGKSVGLEEVDNDVWNVSYYALVLRRITARHSLRF